MARFHFCSYWQTWSRVLSAKGGWYVEVDLTPINAYRTDSWEKVAQTNIRRHCTPRQRGDIETDHLPSGARASMVERLGEAKTAELLDRDFLPEIDWSKYEAACNGGAAFEAIRHA